jgi:hypothetical protein
MSSFRCVPRMCTCRRTGPIPRTFAKIFLGEYLEFQVKVDGGHLFARVHPSFSPSVGTRVFVALPADKCVAVHDSAVAE